MLSAFGLSEVSRTGQPAVLGNLTVIIDDLIRNTTEPDWDDWLQLKPAAAERLARELAAFIAEEHGYPAPATAPAIEGEWREPEPGEIRELSAIS